MIDNLLIAVHARCTECDGFRIWNYSKKQVDKGDIETGSLV